LLHETLTRDGRTVRLRLAVESDAADLIQAVDAVAREGAYFLRSRFEIDVEKERAFIAAARERGDLMLVAVVGGRLVGWVTLFRGRAEFLQHVGELGMGVIQGYRGLGIGAALMDHTLRWAAGQGFEKINLGVRATNQRARALYRKFGFVEEGHKVRQIKDLEGRYDDDIEMAYFVAPSQSSSRVAGDRQEA
jgi:ribosomal protein S18 acetylase RimI-like enzyme